MWQGHFTKDSCYTHAGKPFKDWLMDHAKTLPLYPMLDGKYILRCVVVPFPGQLFSHCAEKRHGAREWSLRTRLANLMQALPCNDVIFPSCRSSISGMNGIKHFV